MHQIGFVLGIAINGRAYRPMDVRDESTLNDLSRERLGMTGTASARGGAGIRGRDRPGFFERDQNPFPPP